MELDPELENVLQQLFAACDVFQIAPRLVGGLAVRGYTRRKRYTHDIDLAVDRQDKANLVAILKQLGFEYQDQTAFKGVKAWRQIGNATVEFHIAIDRLWDMRSQHEYVLSAVIARVPVDERGEILSPVPAVEDLLILKLLPLRDQDMADVVALLLDNPGLDATAFWENCQRTGNTEHILHRLTELEQRLKDGTGHRVWQAYYAVDLSVSEALAVLQRAQSLRKSRP